MLGATSCVGSTAEAKVGPRHEPAVGRALGRDDRPEVQEFGDLRRRRLLHQDLGRDVLDDAPGLHDGDGMSERESLGLVMRHIDGGEPEAAHERGNLAGEQVAQLPVEVRQGFIEQDEPRLGDDGAGDRHPLLLAAREARHAAIGKAGESDTRQGGIDSNAAVARGNAAHFERKGDIAADIEVRP